MAALYGILDLGYISPEAACAVARRMIEGGIDLIQLRAKRQARPEIESIARDLHSITQPAGIPLVINDDPAIAAAIGAEGLHLGQEDGNLAAARARAGGCFIGRSTHSFDQAVQAEAEGADYIGFGPLFATPTKPDYTPIGLRDIRRVHEALRIPIFCIGGIHAENLPAVLAAGARRVVMVSGILLAADVAAYTRAAKELVSSTSASLLTRN